jgi:hypothetical protein
MESLNAKVKSLLSPDSKICVKQESPNCLIAGDKSLFTGRLCKHCFAIKNNTYYMENKAILNKKRVEARRNQKLESVERNKSLPADEESKIPISIISQ